MSYNDKHNEANGEDNTDGESHNRSWNCGVEGPTDDAGVLALRAQQSRNFLATLFLSQGVPMICHGDEIGRTQQGNNNGYCQDNELTWIDWGNVDVDLLAFTATVAELRAQHPVFRRRRFFDGRPIGRRGDGLPDIEWLRPDGSEMTEENWSADFGRAIAVFLNGDAHPRRRRAAANGSATTRSCCASTPITRRSRSPCRRPGSDAEWQSCSTPLPPGPGRRRGRRQAGDSLQVAARSLVVLQASA